MSVKDGPNRERKREKKELMKRSRNMSIVAARETEIATAVDIVAIYRSCFYI